MYLFLEISLRRKWKCEEAKFESEQSPISLSRHQVFEKKINYSVVAFISK